MIALHRVQAKTYCAPRELCAFCGGDAGPTYATTEIVRGLHGHIFIMFIHFQCQAPYELMMDLNMKATERAGFRGIQ